MTRIYEPTTLRDLIDETIGPIEAVVDLAYYKGREDFKAATSAVFKVESNTELTGPNGFDAISWLEDDDDVDLCARPSMLAYNRRGLCEGGAGRDLAAWRRKRSRRGTGALQGRLRPGEGT